MLEQGDYAAALDTGAYYFAHHYAYNSLARPGVYGFVSDGGGGVAFATVREAQTRRGDRGRGGWGVTPTR